MIPPLFTFAIIVTLVLAVHWNGAQALLPNIKQPPKLRPRTMTPDGNFALLLLPQLYHPQLLRPTTPT